MTIEEIKKRLQEIVDALNDENSDADTKALEEEARGLNAQLKKLQGIEARKNVASQINAGMNVAVNVTPTVDSESRDKTSTLEYRKSFMKYVLTGEQGTELRADATTKTSDIGSVIPSTIMNKIYEKMETYGKIYAKVTKTNFKGGLSIPTSSLKPVANWIAEGSVAEKQKKSTGSVIFAYNKLQVRVSISLEADTVSLDVFEKTVVDNCYEAMIVALETSVFTGNNEGQPNGIITAVSSTIVDKIDYATLCEIEGNVPEEYDDKAEYYMTKKEYFAKVVGLVDADGQPIARTSVGIDGKPKYDILGRAVNFIRASYLNGKFAVIGDLSDYVINSNMELTMKKYFDENTDEWINKCTLICDGDLASKDSFQVIQIQA